MFARTASRLGFGTFCVLILASCESSPNPAFPSAQDVVARTGHGSSTSLAMLERGRKIYATSCTECHVARPIAHYSAEQWRRYVSLMAPRAGLKPADQAAVEAYVIAAREVTSKQSDQ